MNGAAPMLRADASETNNAIDRHEEARLVKAAFSTRPIEPSTIASALARYK